MFFRWALLAWKHPVEDNAGRVKRLYPFVNEFDLRGFEFPIKISDIDAIERRNGITINVYTL